MFLQFNHITLHHQSAAIACRRLLGTHSFDRIAQILQEIMSFGLDKNKVVAFVTDNASYFAEALREFGVESFDNIDGKHNLLNLQS